MNGLAGDDVLIGGPGSDTFDGGPGSDVVLDSLAANTAARARPAPKGWLTRHARTAGGKTVLAIAGGEERTLPRAGLAALARD